MSKRMDSFDTLVDMQAVQGQTLNKVIDSLQAFSALPVLAQRIDEMIQKLDSGAVGPGATPRSVRHEANVQTEGYVQMEDAGLAQRRERSQSNARSQSKSSGGSRHRHHDHHD